MLSNFPKTRFLGSKYKLLSWIETNVNHLKYDTVLDAFSGTSAVSYMFKSLNKEVYSNDIMKCNYWISKALIENNKITLDDKDVNFILNKHINIDYDNFIERTFKDIYYTDEENALLDIIIQNIFKIECIYKKSLALWVLFQSCIIKRPFNLFHRKNLSMRISEVKRSFGNKSSWDKSFEYYFHKFSEEINNAVFDNNRINKVSCKDVLDFNKTDYDLVYIDTPYIPSSGTITKYSDFYHFLNGMLNYDEWSDNIDYNTKNLKLKSEYDIWSDKNNIIEGFSHLFNKFKESKLVISYRSDGIPSIDILIDLLYNIDKKCVIKEIDYKYVLSKKQVKEILIIAV